MKSIWILRIGYTNLHNDEYYKEICKEKIIGKKYLMSKSCVPAVTRWTIILFLSSRLFREWKSEHQWVVEKPHETSNITRGEWVCSRHCGWCWTRRSDGDDGECDGGGPASTP